MRRPPRCAPAAGGFLHETLPGFWEGMPASPMRQVQGQGRYLLGGDHGAGILCVRRLFALPA